MTDANLADQIERWLADDPDHMGLHSLSEAQWRGIAAAMRRQPSSDQVLVQAQARIAELEKLLAEEMNRP